MRLLPLISPLLVFSLPAATAAAQAASCPAILAVRPTIAPPQTWRTGEMVPTYALDSRLEWVACPAPEYPAGAAPGSTRNRALLSVTVDETGDVADVKPRGAIDPEGFYEAALAAVRQWKSTPPRWKGLAVKTSFAMDVTIHPPGMQPAPAGPPVEAPSAQSDRPCPGFFTTGSSAANPMYREGSLVPGGLLDARPQWIHCPVPDFAGATGGVAALAITINEEGRVAEVRPRGDARGTIYALAMAAVANWRAAPPPRYKGVAVRTVTAVDIIDGTGSPRLTPAPPASASLAAPPREEAPANKPAPAATPTPAPPRPVEAPKSQEVSTAPAAPLSALPPPPPRAEPTPIRTTAMETVTVAGHAPRTAEPAPREAEAEAPFAVEYYYKVKWGFADEFWRLFLKNHWPVLRKQMESGRILSVRAEKPRYHATEDSRWDFRVTIVFRGVAAAFADVDTPALERQLFPDQETFRREEQRRFELLLAHWDVPVVPLTMPR